MLPTMAAAAGPIPPNRWERVKEVLDEALAAPETNRAVIVAALCAGDDALAAEVESLLAAHAEAGAFMETPALELPGLASILDGAGDAPAWEGRRVGAYVLVREIGRGGMGVVYLAVRADDEYQKQVAIKVVRSSYESAAIHQRFRHERQILAGLDHRTSHA